MPMKKQYFTFQTAHDNRHEFEIVYNPDGEGSWNTSTDPQAICDYFGIKIKDYLKEAEKYGAKIVEPCKGNFTAYPSPRFLEKGHARKFIKEYLEHYITLASLMKK